MNNFTKRGFDIVVSFFGLTFSWWLIFIAWIVATFETKSNGFFIQKRVGKDGKIFNELVRGEDSRKDFFNKIIDIVTLLGGDSKDVF